MRKLLTLAASAALLALPLAAANALTLDNIGSAGTTVPCNGFAQPLPMPGSIATNNVVTGADLIVSSLPNGAHYFGQVYLSDGLHPQINVGAISDVTGFHAFGGPGVGAFVAPTNVYTFHADFACWGAPGSAGVQAFGFLYH